MMYRFLKYRSQKYYELIGEFLKKNERVLDIGAGSCTNTEFLKKRGMKMTPLDVRNISVIRHIKPVLYDGKTIPFKKNSFDVALILSVLHHTPDPEKIIREAKRVAKRLIIMEDIYYGWVDKLVTHILDSLSNLEFFGHPHSNRTDEQWQKLFRKLKLKIKKIKYGSPMPGFKFATYYLQK